MHGNKYFSLRVFNAQVNSSIHSSKIFVPWLQEKWRNPIFLLSQHYNTDVAGVTEHHTENSHNKIFIAVCLQNPNKNVSSTFQIGEPLLTSSCLYKVTPVDSIGNRFHLISLLLFFHFITTFSKI